MSRSTQPTSRIARRSRPPWTASIWSFTVQRGRGPGAPRLEYERTNVRGLETLVRTALAAGVRRLVHVSSATVHGVDVRGSADEETPFRKEPNPYTRSKVAGERLLERMIRNEQAPVSIVRPGWIYGPRDTASFGRLARLDRRRQDGDGGRRAQPPSPDLCA